MKRVIWNDTRNKLQRKVIHSIYSSCFIITEAVVQRCFVKKCSWKFRKFYRKTSVPESLFYKVAKRETQAQFFSCEFCEIFNGTFLIERLCTTASVISGEKKDHCVKNSRKPKFFSSLYFRFYQYLQSMKFS